MPATTFVARTETGTVTRSSSTRTYAYAVLVKTSKSNVFDGDYDAEGRAVFVPDTRPEGAWGWSGDYVNATKMARQAEKVYRNVRVVPVLKLQPTEPAAMLDSSEKWHAVDLDGNVVVYGRTKADVVEAAGRTRRAADGFVYGLDRVPAGPVEAPVEPAAVEVVVEAPAAVCVACGKPSPVEFCSRPECLTYGSGAIAAGPSIVSDTLRIPAVAANLVEPEGDTIPAQDLRTGDVMWDRAGELRIVSREPGVSGQVSVKLEDASDPEAFRAEWLFHPEDLIRLVRRGPAVPLPIVRESRTCFGISWFVSEADAELYAQHVRECGLTINGGFHHGSPCGRAREFDFTPAAQFDRSPAAGLGLAGVKLYAVTD